MSIYIIIIIIIVITLITLIILHANGIDNNPCVKD